MMTYMLTVRNSSDHNLDNAIAFGSFSLVSCQSSLSVFLNGMPE
jgi:hypothetical protein